MSAYAMDKLFESVRDKGHVCVGLDTAAEYIPPAERHRCNCDADAVLAYNRALVDAVIDTAACFKVQIAYYEEMGVAGLSAYAQTLKYIRQRGALVIADVKRSDIADTADRYARAHFCGDFEADFVTLSPYMGMDSIDPWLALAENREKGAFVLLRTSNKGMRDFEYLHIVQDDTNKKDRRLYHAVGDKLAKLAEDHKTKSGYGIFGAVVGADPKSGDEREEALEIRRLYKDLFFLIPGYGAQGGAADDAALLLREGNGGVVNASRSILKAWTKDAAGMDMEKVDNNFAASSARKAALEMRDAIRAAVQKS
ncbi:orotidine 5'-phosphate decarboxylase [Spirochaetia bacterium]|nr:orotidine 5'-phosphate decarboxylase [Spirochaetia bacterium]